MERSEKEALVAEYKEIFQNAPAGVLVDYQGMTVEELTTLRKSLFAGQSKFRVVKNRLARIAAVGTPYEVLSADFTQTRAFIYSEEDAVAPAKIMTKAAKDFEKINLVSGCLITGDHAERLDKNGVIALGNLPSREELLTKLLFVMNGTATSFVRTLNEVPSKFVRGLQAVADSKN